MNMEKGLSTITRWNLESLTPDQVAVIKSTVAKGATDTELQWFLYQCQELGLNPLTKEIWFIKRVKKQKLANGNWDYPKLGNGQIDYSGAEIIIMTSKDGYFKKATENPEFLGIQSMEVRENDDFEMEFDGGGMKVKKHSWKAKDRGNILSAWAVVTYKDGSKDWNYVNFTEYCQAYNGKATGSWASNPTAMIKKCAENPLLKKAARLSGVTTAEEMEHVIESDSGAVDTSPEKTNVREEAVLKYLQKIQNCKDFVNFDKIKDQLNSIAAGFTVEELKMLKDEIIKKKNELTPAVEKPWQKPLIGKTDIHNMESECSDPACLIHGK